MEQADRLPTRPNRAFRSYYSSRKKNGDSQKLTFQGLTLAFFAYFKDFENCGYFAESFGQPCLDGDIEGTLGSDIPMVIFLSLGKKEIWPVHEKYQNFTEEDLFDLIEFLYDHVSKPTDGYFHSYSGCGWHYSAFDRQSGRVEFREAMNSVLDRYKDGFSLSEEGEIFHAQDTSLQNLMETSLPTNDRNNVELRVLAAQEKFRRYKSNLDDRRDAVRTLVDVLEYLRPQIKVVLAKDDEKDLFNIANNFGIRHHNLNQKTSYNQTIWLSWMFHHYLATIHAVVHLIKEERTP